MRMNYIPCLDRPVSVFGFGCASIGSRVSEKDGRSALDRAFDHGVTWFDVAPSYGDGQAERILGDFIANKRDKLAIATKIGIAPPPRSRVSSLIKPLARSLVEIAPSLRYTISRHRPPPERLRLSQSLIEESIVGSLRSLKTDYVDVIALHEPSPADVGRYDVYESLERMVDRGYARAVSVAGSVKEDLAYLESSPVFKIAQLRQDPYNEGIGLFPGGIKERITFVTHGIFGVKGVYNDLVSQLISERGLIERMDRNGFGGGPREIAEKFLLSYALASNPNGVCLLSMNKQEHLQSALSASLARMHHNVDELTHILSSDMA